MKKQDKEIVLGNAKSAKLYIEETINDVLSAYDRTWAEDESKVDGKVMSDRDWLIYAKLCKAREALKYVKNTIEFAS